MLKMMKNRCFLLLFPIGPARSGIRRSSIHAPGGRPTQQEPFARALGKNSYFWPFLASGVVRMGPDRRYDSFGLCFKPNRRFSTHFEPFSMIRARTDILHPTWASMTRPRTATWSGLDPSKRLRKGPGSFRWKQGGSAPLPLFAQPLHHRQPFWLMHASTAFAAGQIGVE